MKLAFTGHRPEGLTFDFESDEYFQLETALWREIGERMESGYDTFYSGAARGMDIICGKIVLAERETRYPNVKLICAIPFKEQPRKWDGFWKWHYYELLHDADRIVQVCDSYQRGCYHMRNRYMVDNCDTLIAIYSGSGKGGTAYTVKYAIEQGKEVVIFNPDTLERTLIPAKRNESPTK